MELIMKNKAGIFISVLCLAVAANAARQIEPKGDAIALSKPGEYYMSPKWSPDGDRVAVGGPSYTGLYLLEFPTGNVTQVSSDYSAGYGFAWSHDGTQIASKISHFEKMRRSHTLVSFNLSDGSMQKLSEPRTRMSGIPVWTANDSHIFLTFAEKFESFSSGTTNRELEAPSLHYIREGRFQSRIKQRSAQSIESTLFEDQDHIYSYALSPDEAQVVYSTAGQNLWLANVDGSNRKSLGRGSAPAWSPDGKWIVFMLTFDDGHSITGSEIYVINAKDGSRINITSTPGIHEMNPQRSPDGTWIAYDTDQLGQIFVQQVGWR